MYGWSWRLAGALFQVSSSFWWSEALPPGGCSCSGWNVKIKRGQNLPLLGYSWGEDGLRTGPAAAPVRCAVRELTALRTEVCVCSSIHLASGLVLPWLPNFQTAAEALLFLVPFCVFCIHTFMYVIHTYTYMYTTLKKIACLC